MKSNTIWVLLSGLAVGVLIGREWGRSEHPSASDDKAAQQAKADQPTQAGPIPTDWLTETDLKVADKFAGLTPAQRYLALKIINATPCDCGCPHGSFAKCAKEDPGCPRAPGVIAQVASLVKDGKSESDIKSAIAKPANAQRPPEQTAQKVELAKWTPVRGPKHAKVTILEFSDFQ